MAAKMIFIILLIYRTFSNMVAGIIVHAIDFKDVNIEMGKNFTVLFADFDQNTTQETQRKYLIRRKQPTFTYQ